MKAFWFLVLTVLPAFAIEVGPNQTIGQGQLAYYGDFDPNQGGELKNVLFSILSSTHSAVRGQEDTFGPCQRGARCYKQAPVGYSNARVIIFGQLYVESDARGTFVEDVYCAERTYFRTVQEIARMNNVINIEHTWPQSRFSNQFDKNMQKEDMHHLFPTNSRANAIRGNWWFGQSGNDGRGLEGMENCRDSSISRGGDRVFTPPTVHRGNVARAMFYFSVRYQMPIDATQERVLRQWHAADPVDQEEEKRHALIADHQLVRNPFIDFPELVGRIRDF
jgi:deoxyribonuclease-1